MLLKEFLQIPGGSLYVVFLHHQLNMRFSLICDFHSKYTTKKKKNKSTYTDLADRLKVWWRLETGIYRVNQQNLKFHIRIPFTEIYLAALLS